MQKKWTQKAGNWLAGFVLMLGLVIVLVPAPEADAAGLDKMDRITLADGRTFVGEVIEETETTLTMEVHVGSIVATRIWNKRDLIDIAYDVVDSESKASSGDAVALSRPDRHADLPDPDDPRPVVYKIPLRGLIGWDVYPPMVREMWEEAVEIGADIVIFEFDCHEGHYDLEEIRDMIQDFKAEAADNEIDLYAWVKEARGTAVAYVLMFNQIIFDPNGWMGEGHQLDELLKEMWSDDDVRAKMISAWVGICRGMAVDGGHDSVLCEAMIRPELTLAVDLEGDRPHFYSNPTTTEYEMVDSSEEEALKLDADEAKRFGVAIARPARDVEGIMQRLDIRDFYYYEGDVEEKMEKWMELRQRGYEDYRNLRADMELAAELAEDPSAAIGQQINKLKEIRRLLRKCPPHTKPPYGINPVTYDLYGIYPLDQIDLEIEALQKQLREAQRQEREERRNRRNSGGGDG